MSLREQITDNLKTAMKEQDKRRISTLRLVNAAIKDRDIANRGLGKPPADEAEILGLLARMIKQREDSAKIYESAGRAAAAAEERLEIEIITGFLPRRLSDAETEKAVQRALSETEAVSLRDMGRVMAWLKERYAGQMDFSKAGLLVRKTLQ